MMGPYLQSDFTSVLAEILGCLQDHAVTCPWFVRLLCAESGSFYARYQQRRKIMLAPIGFLNGDLRDVAGSGQYKIRVFDPVLISVGRPNNERLKRNCVE